MDADFERFRHPAARSESMEGPHAVGETPSDGRPRVSGDGGPRRAVWERDAPAVAEEVAGLRHGVAAAACEAGATESLRGDLALAVSEALSNVVNHAYDDRDTPGRMWLALSVDGSSLVVEVRDDGNG